MLKKWDETRIKAILIDHLIKEKGHDSIICSEIPFAGGKRRVDILKIKGNLLIAYEIKSDLDSLTNLKKQLDDYINTFNEVYVVLSKKFIGKHKILPKNVGYYWVDPEKRTVILKRKSQRKKRVSKKTLSYFLWKKDIPKAINSYKDSIELIRSRITKHNTTTFIHNLAIQALKKRYKVRFDLFLKERSNKTHFSDINILTRKEIRIDFLP